MPKIESIIRCEINPASPVPELCDIIAAVSTHSFNRAHEQSILIGVRDAIDKRLAQLTPPKKGDETNGEQVCESNRNESDK